MSDGPSLWPLRCVTLFHATIAGILGAGFIGPVRSAIQREYDLSLGSFGVALAVLALLGAAVGFAAMPWLRRYHPYGVVCASLAISTAAVALLATTDSLVVMAICWAVHAACSIAGAHMNTIIRWSFDARPRLGINLMHGVNAIGKVLGPALVGMVLVYALPWRWSLAIVALCQGLTLVAFALLRSVAKNLQTGTDSADRAAAPEAASPPATTSRRWFWAATLPFALIAGSEAAFASILPPYLIDHHGLAEGTAAGLLAIHLVGLVIGRLVVTALPERISNRTIILTCCIPAIVTLAVPSTGSVGLLAALLMIAGLPFSATYATFYDSGARHAHHNAHSLAFGAGLFSAIGVHGAIGLTSLIADWHLTLGMLFGPAVILGFAGWAAVTPLLHAHERGHVEQVVAE